MRILLVEDEPSAARMLAKGLLEQESLISTRRGEGDALFGTLHTHQQS